MKIQGKHFVITGGGSGLGAATAEYLVEKGASVTLVDMNVEAGEQQAQALGGKAEFVKLDVTDERQQSNSFKMSLPNMAVYMVWSTVQALALRQKCWAKKVYMIWQCSPKPCRST